MNLRNRDRFENLTLAGIGLAASHGENGSACVSDRMTRSPQILQSLMVAANGEAERPRRSAGLEPRVHTVFEHPRRHC
jgi:hypothetical protein